MLPPIALVLAPIQVLTHLLVCLAIFHAAGQKLMPAVKEYSTCLNLLAHLSWSCMPVHEITDANFDELTESSAIVLLDFWAPWCAPCHRFAPVFEAASLRHPEILFGKINTEVEEGLAKQFSIFSVPTLIASKNGTIVFARPGTLSEPAFEKLIQEVISMQVEE